MSCVHFSAQRYIKNLTYANNSKIFYKYLHMCKKNCNFAADICVYTQNGRETTNNLIIYNNEQTTHFCL